MINYFKNTPRGLEMLPSFTEGCWINVINPTIEEVAHLEMLGLPQDFITYPLDINERSRIEWEDNSLILVIIRVPVFQGLTQDIPYTSIPLGIVLTDRFVMTVCRMQNDIIQSFMDGQVRSLSTSKRNRFVLRVLLSTAQKYLFYLREINKKTDALEDQLQVSMKNKDMLELLKYQKSLVYFTTALKANQLVLERLQRGSLFQMYPDDEDLLEDVITENQQAIETVNIATNILLSMMDTFGSIISNNLNDIMKFLASITIVLSLPNIITSFYGMNVGLPFEQNPFAYLMILGIITAISALVVVLFVKRDWF